MFGRRTAIGAPPACCTFAAVDIAAILGEAWSLYTRFFVRFVVVAGVVFLALGAVTAIVESATNEGNGSVAGSLFALAVSIVGYFWIQGVLVVLTADVRDGVADHSFQELFQRVRPKLGALILAGLLASIGIVIGFILLIVPGLYLLTRWSLIAPALVIEDLSAGESFGRSHHLVRGNAWPVFGLLVLFVVINIVVGGAIVGAAGSISGGLVSSWIASAAANTLITPFIAIATTLVYFRLAGGAQPRGLATDAF